MPRSKGNRRQKEQKKTAKQAIFNGISVEEQERINKRNNILDQNVKREKLANLSVEEQENNKKTKRARRKEKKALSQQNYARLKADRQGNDGVNPGPSGNKKREKKPRKCRCELPEDQWDSPEFRVRQGCKKCSGKFSKHTVKRETRKQRKAQRKEKFDVGNRGVVLLGEHEEYLTWLLQEVKESESVEEGVHHSKVKLDDINNISTLSKTTIQYSRLVSNRSLDDELYFQLMSKENCQQYNYNRRYQNLMDFRKKLPSYAMKDNIVKMVENSQVSLISGDTGCGKTTQVAQFILDDYIKRRCGSMCHIICTQPRRISAVSVAERISSERNEPLGESCGYKIRMENKFPRTQGSILFCTLGVLLRIMINDPFLQKVSHVIIDEIHERDTLSDFLLIIIKNILQQRPHIKIILMSATLNAETFSQFFNNCPVMKIPGRTYPVQTLNLEDILERIDYQHLVVPNNRNTSRKKGQEQQEQYTEYLSSIEGQYTPKTISNLRSMDFNNVDDISYDLVIAVVNYICQSSTEGAILIFLPGWQKIKKLLFKFNDHQVYSNKKNYIILPLHSKLPTASQKEVFDRPPSGCRKIILATNIAETSITIDDVIFVIDCGKSKEKSYNINSNVSSLDTSWISKASAKQRGGRAGRVQPGHCFRLYTKFHENNFRDFQIPEILRTTLVELCLQIKILKCGNISEFLCKAIEPPTPDACQKAIDELVQMTALDRDEKLTSLGYHLALLPVTPKIGRMILCAAIFSCLDPVLTVAASLESKDPFLVPPGREEEANERKLALSEGSNSDHIVLINAFHGWECCPRNQRYTFCRENFLAPNSLEFISGMKNQFTQLLREIGFVKTNNPKNPDSNLNSRNINLVKAVVCAGVYPNVGKIKFNASGKIKKITSVEKAKTGITLPPLAIHPKSVNRRLTDSQSQWIIYHEKMKLGQTFMFDTSVISPYPLLFFGGVIRFHQDWGVDTIEVDEGIKFHSTKTTAEIIMGLRKELDKLLHKKINNPSMELVAGLMIKSDEKIMNAIIELISHEVVQDKKSLDLLNAALEAAAKATEEIEVTEVDEGDDFIEDYENDVDNGHEEVDDDDNDDDASEDEDNIPADMTMSDDEESVNLSDPDEIVDSNGNLHSNEVEEILTSDEEYNDEISIVDDAYNCSDTHEVISVDDRNYYSFVDDDNGDGFNVENY